MSILHFFLLLSAITVWGVNFVAIEIGLQAIPPILLCFARFLFCMPALLFIKRPAVPWKKIAIYSLVMFVFQFSLLFSGMRSGITPGLASILLQFQAFFAIAFAVIFMKEPYRFWQGVGGIAAISGVVLVATHIGQGISGLALLLVLSAAVMWSAGSILAKRMETGSGLALVVWSSLFASPPLFLLSYLMEGPEAIRKCLQTISWVHLGAVCYISWFSTLFAFGVWNWLLRFYPISKLAPFTLLVPIVGMLSSALLIGEALPWWKITAAGLIIGGVAINILASKATVQAVEPKKEFD